MFTETLFWQNLFGFPLWGNLGGRYRGFRRFRIGWRGSEGDRAKLGVRGLRRAREASTKFSEVRYPRQYSRTVYIHLHTPSHASAHRTVP